MQKKCQMGLRWEDAVVKVLSCSRVQDGIRDLCVLAATTLPGDVAVALMKAQQAESNPLAKEILGAILENAKISASQKMPICQDTGVAHVFLQIGQDLRITGGSLLEAVTKGVSLGYVEGFLRKSVVSDPLFERVNTGDNTPPIVHVEVIAGDRLTATVMPKGVGSENVSAVSMLTPADGVQGVRRFVLETVERGGANACPPLIVGVGVGGMMDSAALLAKKALLRPVGAANKDERVADIESELLESINQLGIGPAGLGGDTTALAVHIETGPTHIGALPVAVNIQCHALRRASMVLEGEEEES